MVKLAVYREDLKEAAASLGLRNRVLWRRVLLPAVFPAYVTGGLTASGGAWKWSKPRCSRQWAKIYTHSPGSARRRSLEMIEPER